MVALCPHISRAGTGFSWHGEKSVVTTSGDSLIVEVLRVVGLCKEVPSFGNQAKVLDDECGREQRLGRAGDAGREERQGHGKRQAQERPPDEPHHPGPPSVKKLPGVERPTHEALRLLRDARMLDTD